jgi:hypothetical protein
MAAGEEWESLVPSKVVALIRKRKLYGA